MALLNRSPLFVRFLAGVVCVVALAALTALVPVQETQPGQMGDALQAAPTNVATVLSAR